MVFYHINYCHPSVHTTFRLTYETSRSTAQYMLKVMVRNSTKPLLKQLELAPTQSLMKGIAGKCIHSSNLQKKQVPCDNPFNCQNSRNVRRL